MPAFTATAPGKIILFGEHAVVYGEPALAVPISDVQARATIQAELSAPPGQMQIIAPDIGLKSSLHDLAEDHPLKRAVQEVLDHLDIPAPPACSLTINSTIPIASGMGSGAAVSTAIIRAFSGFLGHPLPAEQVSKLTFAVEKIHHGTPSGIDNTVIACEQPVFYQKGEPLQIVSITQPFTLVIAHTGISSPTGEVVGSVRQAWKREPDRYEDLFSAVGKIAREARIILERGTTVELGPLMDENQALLEEMGVSSPELEALIQGARAAGALGAKLSGGGWGGNMLALAQEEQARRIARALTRSGATRTIINRVESSG